MRLIDADKLETHEQVEPLGNGNYEYVEVVYKDDIDDAPTIELERKTNIEMNWATYFDNMGEAVIHIPYSYKCGNCGCQLQRTYNGIDITYCPACGYRLEWK